MIWPKTPPIALTHIVALHDAERAILLKYLNDPPISEDQLATLEQLITSHKLHIELITCIAQALRQDAFEEPPRSISKQVAEWLGVTPKSGE